MSRNFKITLIVLFSLWVTFLLFGSVENLSHKICKYMVWWYGALKEVTNPVIYFFSAGEFGKPYFKSGTPNGILGIYICLCIVWVLFSELFGLCGWAFMGGDKYYEIEERRKTWQYWFGFLVGFVLGPAIFVILLGFGAMITGACKGDKKE